MRGIFFSGLLGILVAICTVGGVSFFFMAKDVGLVIPSFVLLLMMSPLSRAITYATVVGVILDSYALNGLYLHTIRFLLLVAIGFFISRQWLTNRSLYTGLVLGGILTTLDQLWIGVAGAIHGMEGAVLSALRTLGVAYGIHGLLIVIGFTGFAFFSKRLSSPIGRGGPSDWYV